MTIYCFFCRYSFVEKTRPAIILRSLRKMKTKTDRTGMISDFQPKISLDSAIERELRDRLSAVSSCGASYDDNASSYGTKSTIISTDDWSRPVSNTFGSLLCDGENIRFFNTTKNDSYTYLDYEVPLSREKKWSNREEQCIEMVNEKPWPITVVEWSQQLGIFIG